MNDRDRQHQGRQSLPFKGVQLTAHTHGLLEPETEHGFGW